MDIQPFVNVTISPWLVAQISPDSLKKYATRVANEIAGSFSLEEMERVPVLIVPALVTVNVDIYVELQYSPTKDNDITIQALDKKLRGAFAEITINGTYTYFIRIVRLPQ